MKQKDLPVIIVVVFLSVIISFIFSNKIFAPPKNRQQKVDVVQAITTEFASPDKAYFNSNSIDPTQLITVGQDNNANPFSGPTH